MLFKLILVITEIYSDKIKKSQSSDKGSKLQNLMSGSLTDAEKKFIEISNEYRRSNGKQDCTVDNNLNIAAKIQAEYCKKIKNLTHDNKGKYKKLIDRVTIAGYPDPMGWAENVCDTPLDDADFALNSWKNSPGHNKNMLGGYKNIGIGTASDGDKTYWACVYGNSGADSNDEPEKPEKNEQKSKSTPEKDDSKQLEPEVEKKLTSKYSNNSTKKKSPKRKSRKVYSSSRYNPYQGSTPSKKYTYYRRY